MTISQNKVSWVRRLIFFDISASLFHVWCGRRQPDDQICFCIQSVVLRCFSWRWWKTSGLTQISTFSKRQEHLNSFHIIVDFLLRYDTKPDPPKRLAVESETTAANPFVLYYTKPTDALEFWTKLLPAQKFYNVMCRFSENIVPWVLETLQMLTHFIVQ